MVVCVGHVIEGDRKWQEVTPTKSGGWVALLKDAAAPSMLLWDRFGADSCGQDVIDGQVVRLPSPGSRAPLDGASFWLKHWRSQSRAISVLFGSASRRPKDRAAPAAAW